MEQVYFFSGQHVESDDLNAISETLAEQLKGRTIDFFSQGVVSDASGTFVFNDVNNTIQIYPFIAYNDEGERINVYKTIRALALNLSDPSERRLTQKGGLADDEFGWELNTPYDIYVNYITKVARPRAHDMSGEFFPTRIISGFEFYAMRVGIDKIANNIGNTTLVRLCHLEYDGTNVQITSNGYMDIATIDAGKIYTSSDSVTPYNYNPKTAVVSMEDHVMCLGTGTPSPTNPHGLTPADLGISEKDVTQHEAELHSSGLNAKRSSTRSAFISLLNSTTDSANDQAIADNLVLYNLRNGEQLHFNGKWIDSYSYTGEFVFLCFDDGVSMVPAGTYRIGIDVETGNFIIGSNEGAGYQIRICSNSDGTKQQAAVTVFSEDDYEAANCFDLAEYEFSQTKAQSSIISTYAAMTGMSNFTSQKDLRIFGSMSPNELLTSKELVSGKWEDLLTLPYNVKVSSLTIGESTITGDTTMPFGYIRGFQIAYNSSTAITVYPGRCRNTTGTTDISLTQPITKQVNRQWSQGGFGTAVGGLQNSDGADSALTEYGIPLYVFVIQNHDGVADIALDTDVDGIHITTYPSVPTYSFKDAIRRVGAIYISHKAQAANIENYELVRPFTSFVDGSGLYIQYKNAPTFVYDTSADAVHLNMYDPDTNTFFRTYIPAGIPVKAKLGFNMHLTDLAVKVEDPNNAGTYITYTMHQTNSGSLVVPTAPNTLQYLYGAGQVDLYVENGMITSNGPWDFDNTLTCMGYYDSRDIL